MTGLKLSVMRIYCTNFHVSVPHVTFDREQNMLDLSQYHSNCRGVYNCRYNVPTTVYVSLYLIPLGVELCVTGHAVLIHVQFS